MSISYVFCGTLGTTRQVPFGSIIRGEDTARSDIYKAQQLTQKQSRQIESTKDQRKSMYFGVKCPFENYTNKELISLTHVDDHCLIYCWFSPISHKLCILFVPWN